MCAKDIVLVSDTGSDYVIVHSNAPSPSTVTAATEIQKYIKLISGVDLSIKTDASTPCEHEIVIGYTNREANEENTEEILEEDGFIIKTVGEKVFILGSDVRGALYGAYTFLEKYLGCRFYSSEYEKIPSNDVIAIPCIERDEQVPTFKYRYVDFVTSRKNDFPAKLKINGIMHGDTENTAYGECVKYTGFVHTFNQLVPPSVYGESHPEYWGYNVDGTLQTHRDRQLCLTNPDVLRITKESVRKLLEQNPNTDIISISQNDTNSRGLPCMCPNCRAVYEEEGAYSGAIIRFVNAVANEFAEEYPHVKFDTLAYRYSRSVCKTHPADNVIVRLCTIECCFSHPLGTCGDVYSRPGVTTSIADNIVAWGKITKNVYIWDYVTNFSHPTVMFPNFKTLLPNVKFFLKHNVKGVFEEANYFSETGDFPELRSYIMAKILWNPDMTEAEYWGYIDEFLKDCYGDGWKYIREYIDTAQKLVENIHFGVYDMPDKFFFPIFRNYDAELPSNLTFEKIQNYKSTDWTPFLEYYTGVCDSELIERGDELFDAAMAQATEEQTVRIEKIKLQLDFLKSYFMHAKLSRKKRNIEILLEKFFENDEHSISEAERAELAAKIYDHISSKEQAAYVEYNKTLCKKGLKHNVIKIREDIKTLVSGHEICFSNYPSAWL